MQKKKQNNTIKQIIILIIAVILLLLLIFAEDIIKLTNKNKLNIAENTENELISNEPNVPQLSAGMIPVKWDGTDWIITTSDDKDWYDYANGKPAYIMLNDGTYQSELIRDMTGKKLASDVVGNDALVVPNENDTLGTIFVWIPRFAYKETGETGYIKEETTPGEEWIVSDLFAYKISDETKPDFSLSGVWVAKDIDSSYANKITQMNQEESVYGFIANTKPKQITSTDINTIQNYINMLTANIVENDALVVPIINDITNSNRIILQIVNTSKYEPIKANITHNTQEEKIEIQVTYSSNGIKEILDDNGNSMTLTQENGVIYTNTGSVVLGKGTYSFTVIDNKGNKKLLSITPNIDSLYKVAYINGTDNMDNTNTYTKTQETKTTTENALINQLTTTDNSKTYSRAISNSNKTTTAITQETRTDEDEAVYFYGKYKSNPKVTYYISEGTSGTTVTSTKGRRCMGYRSYSLNSTTGVTSLSSWISMDPSYGNSTYSSTKPVVYSKYATNVAYWSTSTQYEELKKTQTTDKTFYKFVYKDQYVYGSYSYYTFTRYTMELKTNTTYIRGDFVSNVVAEDGTYKVGERNSDSYWYVRNSLAPKYTLQKYDQNLNLQSTYDVDTKTLTTAPIDISNKGNNKLKLTLNTTGTDYKTYISSDNTNWQEVTDITSNTPKELNVDGWDNLYIKIETNTSRINNIDVAFYKD